jgi:hypothetical protein
VGGGPSGTPAGGPPGGGAGIPLSVMHFEKALKSGAGAAADPPVWPGEAGAGALDDVDVDDDGDGPVPPPDEHAATPPTSAVAATVSSAVRRYP